jgi:hypothetical protein
LAGVAPTEGLAVAADGFLAGPLRLVDAGLRSRTFSTLSAWNPHSSASLDRISNWHCRSRSSFSKFCKTDTISEHSAWYSSTVVGVMFFWVVLLVFWVDSLVASLFSFSLLGSEDNDGDDSTGWVPETFVLVAGGGGDGNGDMIFQYFSNPKTQTRPYSMFMMVGFSPQSIRKSAMLHNLESSKTNSRTETENLALVG